MNYLANSIATASETLATLQEDNEAIKADITVVSDSTAAEQCSFLQQCSIL